MKERKKKVRDCGFCLSRILVGGTASPENYARKSNLFIFTHKILKSEIVTYFLEFLLTIFWKIGYSCLFFGFLLTIYSGKSEILLIFLSFY